MLSAAATQTLTGAFFLGVQIHDRFAQLAAEEQRRAEKKLRNAIDDLRYAIRDLDPVVDLESSYEAAQPRLEELKEYKALPDEASRRAAFDKYIARAKVSTVLTIPDMMRLVWLTGWEF